MAHEFDILATLHEIRDLLKKQNELLENSKQINRKQK